MLDREWISITDPDQPYERYVFDVSFLMSGYHCIFGAGCPGTRADRSAGMGCCHHGAHYVTDEDRAQVEAHAELLGPEHFQYYGVARRKGVTAKRGDGHGKTRVVDGGCIFLNRDGWKDGPGCALHQYALARGEHHMTYKPEVCWIVPLRREVREGIGDDGKPDVTTTITSFDRGAWGPGGADFDWWCTTDDTRAFDSPEPLYRTMGDELTAMSSPAVYAELAGYLDRRRKPRVKLPLLRRG